MKLKLNAQFLPSGDQPKAIESLIKGIEKKQNYQILLGATGTGKTFTIANVLAQTNKSAIILSHNKTLAGQLYSELKTFFPENKVEYFISYFDYYKPEAYMPASDTYIDKTSKTNWDIEAMRISAINSLLSGEPTIVVASVASIYGQIAPLEYRKMFLEIEVGKKLSLKNFPYELAIRNYDRTSGDLVPGSFKVMGDVITIAPASTDKMHTRIDTFGGDIERIDTVDSLTGEVIHSHKKFTVLPAEAYTVSKDSIKVAVANIEHELKKQIKKFEDEGKLLEAQRIKERVMYDIDSLKEFGTAPGIENYSMHLDGRKFGERPNTILDYLVVNGKDRKKDPLLIIDESHMMIPQLNAMYNGDHSRKKTLVEYGFRLPSALENRPLKFEEFENLPLQKVYVSATPSKYEFEQTDGEVIPQIVRPTGLLDPTVEVIPTKAQIENIFDNIQTQKSKGERSLILTTTKRMAEELTNYLLERKEKVAYIHSEHKTFERDEILRKLRLGIFDTIVGINLLREGIDLPEVSLVMVLDADKESFFRSTSSLVQIIGRASRNANGHVILYGDKITKSMKEAMGETARRRKIQEKYNQVNNIIPTTIIKAVPKPINPEKNKSGIYDLLEKRFDKKSKETIAKHKKEIKTEINKVRGRMLKAAREMDFERAAQMRDFLLELESMIS